MGIDSQVRKTGWVKCRDEDQKKWVWFEERSVEAWHVGTHDILCVLKSGMKIRIRQACEFHSDPQGLTDAITKVLNP